MFNKNDSSSKMAAVGPMGANSNLSCDQADNAIMVGEKYIDQVVKLQAFARGYVTR